MFVDALRAPLDELLLRLLGVGMFLKQVHSHLLVRFLLLKHTEADSQALRLGIVQKEFTQVHETTACAYKHTTTLDLNSTDLCAHQVSSSRYLDEGKASCKLIDDRLVSVLQLLMC